MEGGKEQKRSQRQVNAPCLSRCPPAPPPYRPPSDPLLPQARQKMRDDARPCCARLSLNARSSPPMPEGSTPDRDGAKPSTPSIMSRQRPGRNPQLRGFRSRPNVGRNPRMRDLQQVRSACSTCWLEVTAPLDPQSCEMDAPVLLRQLFPSKPKRNRNPVGEVHCLLRLGGLEVPRLGKAEHTSSSSPPSPQPCRSEDIHKDPAETCLPHPTYARDFTSSPNAPQNITKTSSRTLR